MNKPINLFSAAHHQNPYPDYEYLRENAPVYKSTDAQGNYMWVVTRYQEVINAFKDPRLIKDSRQLATTTQTRERLQRQQQSREFRILNHNMLSFDPPTHTRLRSLVSKAFTPRRVEELRPRVAQIADTLLDNMAEHGNGTLDLLDAYAFPLPIQVICELLGIPVQDRQHFRQWSNSIVDGTGPNEDQMVNRREGAASFIAYIEKFIEQRRAKPTGDLVSALIQAEEAGDKLNQDELIAMLWLLILAGHETTVNLIGNGMLALFQNPEQFARLKAQPALIKSAVEEFLRFNGSVETSTIRFAAEDLELAGQPIAKGDPVLLVIAGADHDPAIFASPEQLELNRAENPHLAFGYGPHYCLGAPLARLEGQIALSKLLERFPNISLAVAPEELIWRPNLLLRGLRSLPVKLGQRD
jgi:cytochrome P450